MAFLKLKARPRRIGAKTFVRMFDALYEKIFNISQAHGEAMINLYGIGDDCREN